MIFKPWRTIGMLIEVAGADDWNSPTLTWPTRGTAGTGWQGPPCKL